MAGLTRDGGYGADYSSTGTTGFIPQIWAGKLVQKFYLSTVFGSICNTDYEGEIKNMGDTVIIRTTPDVTISDYTIGGGLTYEKLTSNKVDLNIDHGKSFSFSVNDVDAMQSDLKQLNTWSEETSNQMKIETDRDILGAAYVDAGTANQGATAGKISADINLGVALTPLVFTKDNAVEIITDYGVVLDEQNCPEEGRWLILPAWACGRIKNSDLKDASLSGDRVSIARNGRVGMIDRFTIFMSNSLSVAGGEWNIMFGHKAGLTFASQMTKMESMRNPADFDELVRGLHVFGFEVINDTVIGHSVISKA